MAKGSTKYQLLRAEFDHAVRELKLRNEYILELRAENERFKNALEKVTFVREDLAAGIAEKALRKN